MLTRRKLSISVPDEAMKSQNAKFSTRHTAAGILVHIDGTAVTCCGYMPQDILGESILDFFHPDDIKMLKTAYEMLMKSTKVADGRVSTPPYRFLIKNGSYITLETEWTRVFNPWSRNVEFVTGEHCVLRGKSIRTELNAFINLHWIMRMNICLISFRLFQKKNNRSKVLRYLCKKRKICMQISEWNSGKSGHIKERTIENSVRSGALSRRQCETAGVKALPGARLIYGKPFGWRSAARRVEIGFADRMWTGRVRAGLGDVGRNFAAPSQQPRWQQMFDWNTADIQSTQLRWEFESFLQKCTAHFCTQRIQIIAAPNRSCASRYRSHVESDSTGWRTK